MHVPSHFWRKGRFHEAVDKQEAIGIHSFIVYFEQMHIARDDKLLVEYAQQLLQVVAGTSFQVGQLYDNGIMSQAFDERIGCPVGDLVVVIV